jgi:hypothetical protein
LPPQIASAVPASLIISTANRKPSFKFEGNILNRVQNMNLNNNNNNNLTKSNNFSSNSSLSCSKSSSSNASLNSNQPSVTVALQDSEPLYNNPRNFLVTNAIKHLPKH